MTTASHYELALSGLDGGNPLAFLAALGTLRTLSRIAGERRPRLAWRPGPHWTPVLHAEGDYEQEALLDDIMRYVEEFRSGADSGAPLDYAGFADIIGVTPEVFRGFVDDAFAQLSTEGSGDGTGEALDFAAAYGTDFCLSDKGMVAPSLFSFANGQSGQCLLRSLRQIREELARDDLRNALFSAWSYTDPRPTFRWDPRDCRPYALLATDPGDSTRTPVRTVRGANFLAFLALPLFPSAPRGSALSTVGFSRIGRHSCWTWPVWEGPASMDVVRSLIALPELHGEPVDRAALAARGIAEVFRTRRFNYQKGLYFSPAEPV